MGSSVNNGTCDVDDELDTSVRIHKFQRNVREGAVELIPAVARQIERKISR